jgi:hypothetical protein
MRRQLALVLGLALAGTGLSASVPARAVSPVGSRTIAVDDDGHADARGCGRRAPAHTSIQAAVEAASAGARVVVCPGVYRESLTLGPEASGLTIEAMDFWRAVVAPVIPGGDAITIEGATGVTIRGLGVRPVGGVSTLVVPVGPVLIIPLCTPAASAVRIAGGGAAQLRSVRIAAARVCGYRRGILVEDGRASIEHVRVTDFLTAGIAAGAGGQVSIARTDVRFLHGHRDGALLGDAIDPEATGIAIDGALGATITRSAVFSVKPKDDVVRPQLWVGIAIRDVAGDVLIRRSGVRRTVRASFLVLRSSRVTLRGVWARDSWQDGIYLDEVKGGTVLRGNALRNGRGIALGSAAANVSVRDLRSVGSRLLDCHDASSGSATAGTANRWQGVSGATSVPPGICGAAALGRTPIGIQDSMASVGASQRSASSTPHPFRRA